MNDITAIAIECVRVGDRKHRSSQGTTPRAKYHKNIAAGGWGGGP